MFDHSYLWETKLIEQSHGPILKQKMPMLASIVFKLISKLWRIPSNHGNNQAIVTKGEFMWHIALPFLPSICLLALASWTKIFSETKRYENAGNVKYGKKKKKRREKRNHGVVF